MVNVRHTDVAAIVQSIGMKLTPGLLHGTSESVSKQGQGIRPNALIRRSNSDIASQDIPCPRCVQAGHEGW
jgi:hypothetical protein